MECLFKSGAGAPFVLIGQRDPDHGTIENPLAVNEMLSFLIYGTTRAEVKGLDAFPKQDWPDNIPLLFFAYHIMAGLGTLFLALMTVCAFLLFRGRILHFRPALWALMLAFPFPY